LFKDDSYNDESISDESPDDTLSSVDNSLENESIPDSSMICPPVGEEQSRLKTTLLLVSVGIGMFMGALDESIINVSLPTIGNYFGVDQIYVQWIVLVYLLIVVGLTGIAGYLGDRYSTKLIFQIGMIIFSIGSLICALSISIPMLVWGRVIQGVGATGTLANGNAIVTRFSSDEQRGLSIGILSLIAALGVVVGPVLGGAMTQFWGWQSVFWINVPIGAIGIISVQFGVPPTPPVPGCATESDALGSIIFTCFMTTFIISLALIVDPLIPHPMIWAGISFLVSISFFVGFIFRERKAKNPFIDLSLFKNKKFTIGVTCSLITFIALNSIAFQLPFFLQDIMNYTQSKIGAIVIGVPIGLAIAAPTSGKLSSKFDARWLSSAGLLVIGIALTCLSVFISVEIPIWIYVLIAFIIGLSIGFFAAPNSNSIMSHSPKEKLGVVSSLISLARNIGFSIGTALSTTIFFFILELFQNKNGGALKSEINYVPSIKILFGILAFFVAIAVVISFLRGPEHRNYNKINSENHVDKSENSLQVITLDEKVLD